MMHPSPKEPVSLSMGGIWTQEHTLRENPRQGGESEDEAVAPEF